MEILRTPEERFEGLEGFPFKPHYVEVEGMRVHYVDEGQGQVILCLHGEPTWAYLYRKMIPPLSAKYRVVAMDFIGFGRSDKLPQMSDYSFDMHLRTLKGFIEALDLQGIHVVVQDWGGLIGLTTATQMAERFASLIILNTFLPTGEEPMNEAFLRWREFVERFPDLPIKRVIKGAMANPEALSEGAIAGYEAPFPDARYKAGAASWPLLVPMKPDDPGAAEMKAAREALSKWEKPALVMFAPEDPILGRADVLFRRLIPSARKRPRVNIEGAGHFLQEEKGEEIAGYVMRFLEGEKVNN